VSARVLSASDPAARQEAGRLLRSGRLVAFPTETVYGLGANAFDPEAVARVFAVKARPSFDPLIVHLAHASEADRVARGGDPRVERLAARFWPGPLTLVLPRRPEVPEIVTAGLDTVAIRVPGHEDALALLREAGTPVAAPSANPFGYVSPTTAGHVADLLGDSVDLVLDGGPCRVGVESTVLSLVGPPVILRPGGVSREELEGELGTSLALSTSEERPRAPGQLPRHYATRTPLRILSGPAAAGPPSGGGRIGLLAFCAAPKRSGWAVVEVLAPDGRATTAAAHLFAALRRLDAAGLDAILAEPCDESGLGLAIMDRLRRCAARSVEAAQPLP
jgi:L-threonylcarbamoyladenylate synthase